MSPTLRLGLLSTARINHKLVVGARLVDDVDVVAVGSRSRERAAAHAQDLGEPGARAHGSYEEVLADPEVDAVYIALPNSDHVPWAIRALEAGKHVLCEKPLTQRLADASRAFDVAERAGLVLTEAFMWRHHPQTTRMAELLEAGTIGEVRAVRAAFSFPLDAPGDLRLSAELDGGALMDVGCYCVSGARRILGEPDLVGATQVLADGVDVRFAAWMRFPGDRTATFDCGFDLYNRDELEVLGSAGALFLDDPWHGRRPVIEVRRHGGAVEHVRVEDADAYACELRDLVAAVRGERAPLLGRADAEGQARTIEALYRSAAEGRAVEP